ncbi:hypothetical protein Tco_1000620 [Tanacetum coccineum]
MFYIIYFERVIRNSTFANDVTTKITTKNDVTSIVCLVNREELLVARYIFRASAILDPFIFDLLIIFFTAIAPRASDKSSLVLIFWWFWTFSNKMIQTAASKAFSITFTVLVITASLEHLFVVLRLHYESTSSFKELLEVSYYMAYSSSSLPEFEHSSSLDSFLAFKAIDFLSTFADESFL